jgi:CheY-like chemotaxis protein
MARILVVDDNAASRDLLRHILKPLCSEVLEACQGQEALAKIAEAEPDLVLLDLEMPVLDGFGVLQQLRQDPRFTALPVVAVTARAMQGDREKASIAGFTGYITKPVSATVVRNEVKRLLRL